MPVVNYLWNPLNDNIVREFDDAGTVIAEYTTESNMFGNVVSQRRNGQDSVYHYDGQGSTIALTDANGDITDTYSYSAFGEVTAQIGSTVNPFQYIGQKGYYFDEETGECEVRRRTFAMQQSRWLSPDPLWLLYVLNAYHYASNSPIVAIDPSGLIYLRDGDTLNSTFNRSRTPSQPSCSTEVYESIIARCTFKRSGRTDPWKEEIECPSEDDIECCESRSNHFWPTRYGWQVVDSELLTKTRTVTKCTRWVPGTVALGLVRTPQPMVAVTPAHVGAAICETLILDIGIALIPVPQTTTSPPQITYEARRRKRRKAPLKGSCACVYVRKNHKGEDEQRVEPSGRGQITYWECLSYCRLNYGTELIKIIWKNLWYDA